MCIVPMHHIILISVTRDGCYCHNMEEEFEDTKGRGGRIRVSMKNRQPNDQKKKYKRTTNDLQNTHKTKDRVIRTPLKPGGERKSLTNIITYYILSSNKGIFV